MSSGPQRLGKYELQQRLGRGGMAEVWKALDTQLQRYVAIKFLHADLRTDSDFMARFIREAQAIASLRHPHIIQIHDFQVSTGSDTAYMVMNYIEGPTLAEYIRDTSRLGQFPPASDIVYLFTCIGSAIDYAHQCGMVHRDIKPSNIILDRRNKSRSQLGYPILMDFGIVKMLGASSSTLTGTGSLLGTPHYMSPEQARGQAGNERSDIYSLGVILYEICTGVRPFQGDNPTLIMMQHITAMPTPPALINPNIPPALAEVILRSLAKEPAERFPNALAMTQALSQAVNVVPPHTIETQQRSTPLTTPQAEAPSAGRLTPASPGSTTPYITVPPTPQFTISTQAGQHTPATATPTGSMPSNPSVTDNNNKQGAALTPVLPPPSPPLPDTLASKKRPKRRLIISLVAAIFVVVAASLGSFYLLAYLNKPPVTPNTSVGEVSFFSSAADNSQNSSILDDELQISLSNIAPPAQGKSYYGWLLSDETQNPPRWLAVGQLPFENGTINRHYFHDLRHTNLLALYSQFFITEEATNSNPTSPSLDKHTWDYYAELPQISDNGTNQGILTYIRNLLVQADTDNIKTGIDTQFLRNTYQVSLSASTARTAWYNKDVHALHTQLITILDYMDSVQLIQQDAPNTPLLVDQSLIQLPLCQLTSTQSATSLIARSERLLNRLLEAPGITPEMTTLTNDALGGLSNVQDHLQKVYTNVMSLMKMSDAQLLSNNGLTTLNAMEEEANQAYNQVDSTYQSQGGALWIHTRIQNMATLEVKKYP